MRSYAWLRHLWHPATCSCRSQLLILTGLLFLDPICFPRLSYSVGEQMLGTNAWCRLFGEIFRVFASQYFCTVSTFLMSCGCIPHKQGWLIWLSFSVYRCTWISHVRALVFMQQVFFRLFFTAPARLKIAPKSKFNCLLYKVSQILQNTPKHQLYNRFWLHRCRNTLNRKVENQLYDHFWAYRCRNKANRKVN